MHQTTVRFGGDLWEALEQECARLGVSVAQYLREAALTRLVYAAGRRGDEEFEFALELALGRAEGPDLESNGEFDNRRPGAASDLGAHAFHAGSEASAVTAQARLARQRSREVRGRAEADRSRRRSGED